MPFLYNAKTILQPNIKISFFYLLSSLKPGRVIKLLKNRTSVFFFAPEDPTSPRLWGASQGRLQQNIYIDLMCSSAVQQNPQSCSSINYRATGVIKKKTDAFRKIKEENHLAGVPPFFRPEEFFQGFSRDYTYRAGRFRPRRIRLRRRSFLQLPPEGAGLRQVLPHNCRVFLTQYSSLHIPFGWQRTTSDGCGGQRPL